MKDHHTYIEPLEDRIAPATLINASLVTYQDGDGDTVQVKISKPLFTSKGAAANILQFIDDNGNGISEQFTGNSTPENLNLINLVGNTAAQGMSISVKVIKEIGIGNGLVNVGDIAAGVFSSTQLAGGIDLGTVTIQGNLGEIVAGDNLSTTAIHKLDVNSMTSVANSTVLGPIGTMIVHGDFSANLTVAGFQFGNIDNLTIGGTLGGDSAGDANTGVISFQGHIGKAVIGNIVGGAGANSGELIGTSQGTGVSGQAAPFINSLHVTGFIVGGAGVDSGRVSAQGAVKTLTVDKSILGGSGDDSGQINAAMNTVTIGQSLEGGSGALSGALVAQISNSRPGSIAVFAPIKSLNVGGDIVGGGGNSSGVVAGQLATVIVHGSVEGGSGLSSGSIFSETTTVNGSTAVTTIDTLSIGKNLVGGTAGIAATNNTAAVAGDSGIVEATTAKSIYVGGSFIGGTAANNTDQTADTSGSLLINQVDLLRIGTSLVGGSGNSSGSILPQAETATLVYKTIDIKGDMDGGSGQTSGSIFLAPQGIGTASIGSIGTLHVGGSLNGGSGFRSAQVSVYQDIAKLTIDGSVNGGDGSNSAAVIIGGNLVSATIGGSVTGEQTPTTTAAITQNAYIQAKTITALEVKGDVTSGIKGTGAIANSGSIRATQNIVALTIDGDVTGNASNPVVISAQQGSNSVTDLAIGSINIGTSAKSSNVNYLDILAGYSADTSNGTAPLGAPVDGSANVSKILITGNMAASNIVAGVLPDSNGQFGTTGNKQIANKVPSGLNANIASLTVTGTVQGDSNPNDTFGIVSTAFGTVTLDNKPYVPTVGTPKLIDGTTNLYLLEVSPS